MKQPLYVCNMCKNHGEDFQVPADEIGIELMKAHLWNEHELNVDRRKARPVEEDINLDF